MKKKRVAALALLTLIPLAGCYTRTVGAKGLGAQWNRQDIYEPNLKEKNERGNNMFDNAGDLLLGPRQIEERKK
ncbi:MAG: hypothetical protein H6810_00770 [Phycisphaeraceae bacterium]|nr:MAG: hypothetical protein H6810_00770 [Phycisphaeraceae bacterium]